MLLYNCLRTQLYNHDQEHAWNWLLENLKKLAYIFVTVDIGSSDVTSLRLTQL